MGEEKTSVQAKTVNYKIVGETGTDTNVFVQIPIEVSKKGMRTFTLDLDEYQLEETGTKQKDGKAVQYMKFKFIK